MAKRQASRSTLERKSRLIFGLLVLLTVTASLAWPWWQMGRSAGPADRARARTLARAYLQNIHAIAFAAPPADAKQPPGTKPSDETAQLAAKRRELLERFRKPTGDEQARLIKVAPAEPDQPQQAPASLTGFEADAVAAFLNHPEEVSLRRTIGRSFLYAQALRCREGECLDCHQKAYQKDELLGAIVVGLDVAEHHDTVLTNRLILVAAALVILVVSMVIFVALFRQMVVRPVRHLRDVADRVSEGDLQVRSEIDTGNELEVLSDALNHMLDELSKVQADLRAATETRDAKLDELAKANVALFEANQVKTKFVATMSHELRTPLNSIIGFAQVLCDSPAVKDNTKLARYAENIFTSGRMLLELIDDLLDLAQIESGRLQVRCAKVTPQDLAEVVCNMVRPMLPESGLKLAYEVDPETPIMMTDSTKVQQILYNLLSNAIKFTEEGEIRLKVRPVQDERVAFAVSDTGPGIGRDQQLRVFERFTQLDSSYTRRYRGTGLGLSIVRELTGLLGGTASVESEVGSGSTFTVVLPADSSLAEGRTPEDMARPEAADDDAGDAAS
ncbi:MAG TPA: ATP-binding protein [Phycisphaerae bacterium]|nr:ATP-binding protein [Phycisphaerae bacterium]